MIYMKILQSLKGLYKLRYHIEMRTLRTNILHMTLGKNIIYIYFVYWWQIFWENLKKLFFFTIILLN